jgi:hypothetical protein
MQQGSKSLISTVYPGLLAHFKVQIDTARYLKEQAFAAHHKKLQIAPSTPSSILAKSLSLNKLPWFQK